MWGDNMDKLLLYNMPKMSKENLFRFWDYCNNDISIENLIGKDLIVCRVINEHDEYIEISGTLKKIESNEITLDLGEEVLLEISLDEIKKICLLPDRKINEIPFDKVCEITNIFDDKLICYILDDDDNEIELFYRYDDIELNYYPIRLIKNINVIESL